MWVMSWCYLSRADPSWWESIKGNWKSGLLLADLSGSTNQRQLALKINENSPITKRILNTADPTIVPIPTSLNAIKTPIIDVNNSGAEPPAAMNVAPATSSEIPIDVNKEMQRNFFQKTYLFCRVQSGNIKLQTQDFNHDIQSRNEKFITNNG